MSVTDMNVRELLLFLSSKGLSDTGQKSIADNEINGQMLLEFCEDDIHDAFSVFKDRFTIRKVLRELRSNSNDSQPTTVISPTRLPTTQQHNKSLDHQKHSNTITLPPATNKSSQSHHITGMISQHQQPMRGIISLGNTESDNVFPVHMHKSASFIQNVSSAVSNKNDRSDGQPPSNELMSERVSSTDDYHVQQRKNQPYTDDHQRNIYDSAVDALVSLSGKHPGSETDPNTIQKNVSLSRPASSVTSSTIQQPGTSTQSQYVPANNIYGLNYDCTYAWNVMSQKVKSFSADDLLSKRDRFSRPTEAQRLGGILIRNAAHSAGVWKDAPCLNEITLSQRKQFFKFIVSLAPQLSNSQEDLFTRLREALQNRRKYLLDKKLGKIKRRKRGTSSELGLEISEAGSFIDLTEFPGDLNDTDIDLEQAVESVDNHFIKTEHADANVVVKSETKIE